MKRPVIILIRLYQTLLSPFCLLTIVVSIHRAPNIVRKLLANMAYGGVGGSRSNALGGVIRFINTPALIRCRKQSWSRKKPWTVNQYWVTY